MTVRLRFALLRRAIEQCGTPEKIAIDKSGADAAAVNGYNVEADATIELRQIKYLNNIVEQDHRAVKRMTRPLQGFKSFCSAAKTLAGIETTHMICKGQLFARESGMPPAEQFYSPAT